MKTGLLWYDDSKRDLAEKITRAVTHYARKHGTAPNVCHVHPSALNDNDKFKIPGLRVVAQNTVLPHHFWIGKETQRRK